MSAAKAQSADDYTIGWICALPLELAASRLMLDEIHGDITSYGPNDNNSYLFGSIAGHNVVLACLPAGVYGTIEAAVASQQMLSTFQRIRFALLVGIGGGVPNPSSSDYDDIRLGDVVVSLPGDQHSGVMQYDLGKRVSSEEVRPTHALNRPPNILLTAVSQLQAAHKASDASKMRGFTREVMQRADVGEFKQCFPGQDNDKLFYAAYDHVAGVANCIECDAQQLVERKTRDNDFPVVHYGLIASGNQVMKHGPTRDHLSRKFHIKCFEMEAAGLMDNFPSLVIRGICDYADSHKNKHWQNYAALTAAAYAKDLLTFINVREVGKASLAKNLFERNRLNSMICKWISADDDLDVRDELAHSLSCRHGQTCNWLFEDERFISWRDSFDDKHKPDRNRILWYNAPPGSGKTVLSSAVVQHLNETKHKTAYFCYSFNKLKKRDVAYGIRSLAIQLIRLLGTGLPEQVVELFETETNDFNKEYMRETLAETVACDILAEFSLVYLIIDGLDECLDEGRMRTLLSSLVTRSRRTNGTVKWFFTSRDDGKIRQMMENLSAVEICPSSSNIYADIKLFLTSGLDKLMQSTNQVIDLSQIHDLVSYCVQKCDGSFLFSKFVLDTLGGDGITCYDDIPKVLNEFPSNLNDYYLRTLLKLCTKHDKERKLVRRTFMFLVASAQPITWKELRHALSISSGQTDYSPSQVPLESKIMELCGCFIVFNRSAENENKDDCLVSLCHKTVYDFLRQEPKDLATNKRILSEYDDNSIIIPRLYEFFVHPTEASTEIGLDCLRLLSYTRYESVSRAEKILKDGDESDAFLKYAATFWVFHLNDAPRSPEILRWIRKFLTSPNFWTCVAIQSYIDPHMFGRYKKRSGYFQMCLDDPTLNQDDPLGVPLPTWLHQHPQGQKLDLDFCHFVNDWHQVLASHPGVLDQCVSLNRMATPIGNHLPHSKSIEVFNLSDSLSLDEVQSLCSNSLFFYKNRLYIEVLCCRCEDIQQRKIRYYRLPMFSRRKGIEKEFHIAPQGANDILEKEISCWCRLSDGKMDIWKVAESGLSLGHYFADGGYQSFQPSGAKGQEKEVWQVVWKDNDIQSSHKSAVFHLSRQRPELVRKNTGDGYNPWRSDSDSDDESFTNSPPVHISRHKFRTDDDSDEDTQSESSFSDEDYVNIESNQAPKRTLVNEAVVVAHESSSPVWILFNQTALHSRGFTCAVHPELPVLVWSYPGVQCLDSQDHEGRWHIERWPGDLETESSSLDRQLRFSACGNYVYCLEASVSRSTNGHNRRLVLSVYNFEQDDGSSGGKLIENRSLSQEITYKIPERLVDRPINGIFTFWTENEVVVALPPLTCKPKIIKFNLCTIPPSKAVKNEQRQNGEAAIQQVQILRNPVYFPYLSGRDPKLVYQAESSASFHSLFLYLSGKPATSQGRRAERTASSPPVGPVVIRWQVPREDGWRHWESRLDSEWEDWDEEAGLLSMLRGGFVNGERKFNVPIRCGLNWTRQAFLSCY